MPKFLLLERELNELEVLDVVGSVGRTSSFEVVVDGNLVWSKLGKGKFPDFRGLAQKASRARRVCSCCLIYFRVRCFYYLR
jgi:selT/selW/selH-like putative selenoprotein